MRKDCHFQKKERVSNRIYYSSYLWEVIRKHKYISVSFVFESGGKAVYGLS
jgi:hypothetical protein